jgi:hypothetical protein
LTDRQIIECYYRPRDKEGIPLPVSVEHEEAVLTPAQQLERERLEYFAMGISLGINQAQLEAAWQKKTGGNHGG